MDAAIKWMEMNWESIAAAIGTAYAFVRVLVAMTKTEKDDEYMDAFDRYWRKAIVILAKVFGIRPDEGRK